MQTQQQVPSRAFLVLEESDWAEKFKPNINHIDANASSVGWNPDYPERGCMFETYGPDVDYVKAVCAGKIPGLSAANVWTLVDGDAPNEDSPEGLKLKEAGWTYSEDDGWMRDDHYLDTSLICDGWQFVNRVGYFITAVPADANTDYNIHGDDMAAVLTQEVAA